MKQIILLLAVGLGLASCTKEEYVIEHNAYVKVMSNNNVTISAISKCTGLDTSWTVRFGVATCINIASLPEVNDVRYDDYEFYAMINGSKIVGSQGLNQQISDRVMSLVEDNISMQLDGHTNLTVCLLEENYNNAEFFVEANGVITKINLNEIY
tara:strand:- start:785 stop:1246 length:462 start_codon:yes stop_codon:yes gene_type:complete